MAWTLYPGKTDAEGWREPPDWVGPDIDGPLVVVSADDLARMRAERDLWIRVAAKVGLSVRRAMRENI